MPGSDEGTGGGNGATPLVRIRGLCVRFPLRGAGFRARRSVKAVDGVDLDIGPGETLGLVGESGCGKTTLGRAVLGLEPTATGDVRFEGAPLLGRTAAQWRPLRPRLQMVFQDPYASLNPRMTAMDLVTEGLREHGRLRGPRAEAAAGLLREVGLDEDALYRYPFEFSGGQRQRISLARAVALRPAFIVCDEVVSALDVSVQAQVLNLLLDLRAKHGLAYLFISHDLAVVQHVADRTAVMALGRVVEIGPTATVTARPLHPYTRALVASARSARPAADALRPGEPPSPVDPPPGCPCHPRCPLALPVCREREPELRRADGVDVRCHLYEGEGATT